MEWTEQKFKITCFDKETQFKIEEVDGVVSGVFGIYQNLEVFVLSHLPTGYRIFYWETLEGAKEGAEYLSSKYSKEFSKIKTANDRFHLKVCESLKSDLGFWVKFRIHGVRETDIQYV